MKIVDEGGILGEWAGQTPYFLAILLPKGTVLVDLDEPGWMSERPGLMREPGKWVLFAKGGDIPESIPALAVVVGEGDQPYYTKRTFGLAFGGSGEVCAYGIGKKRADGQTDRMWLLPNGMVCSGDDVDIIAVGMLKGDGQR